MTGKLAIILLGVGLFAADEHVPFPPGGVMHVNHSYGYLTVEGWDEPEVEIKATKSPEQIRITAERHSDKELTISTTSPRHLRDVAVDLSVRVPRDSRLIVQHDHGYVWVSNLTGDIEVNSHTGDMIVMLPEPGQYAIDAKTKLGSVSSDFIGRALNQFLLGTRFLSHNEGPSRRIYLRMGRGSITIKKD